MKKFSYRILETIEFNSIEKYKNVKEALVEKIALNFPDKSIDKTQLIKFSSDLENDSSVINAFNQDKDVYEFYLEYSTEIDEILNENEFFNASPESKSCVSLYDYLVKGTRQSFIYLLNSLKEEI